MNDDNGGVRRFFDDFSDDYDAAIARCVPRYAEMLSTLLDYLPQRLSPARILELGCGTGNLAVRVAARYPDAELTLVDVSAEQLERCRARVPSQAICRQVDFRSLVLPEGHFDLVISSISIHHLRSEEKRRLLANAFRWLKEGGAVAIADQFAGATQESYSRHLDLWRRFAFEKGADEEEWRRWMEHQEQHDFHEPLANHLEYLREAGFVRLDCTWRHLLWTIVQAEKDEWGDASSTNRH